MRDFNRRFIEGQPAPQHPQNEVPDQGEVAAMSDISREELDAKLDGTLAKLHAHLASFESAVREMLAAMRVDMVNLRAELRGNLADIRTELRGESADIRAELQGNLADIRAELQASSADIRAELQSSSADIRAELQASSADIHAELRALHVDMSHLKNLKGNIWGAAAVTLGLVGAFLTYGVSSFDSGRDTSALVQELQQQTRETRVLLEDIKRQGAASAAAPVL